MIDHSNLAEFADPHQTEPSTIGRDLRATRRRGAAGLLQRVDHLVYAVLDLDSGIAEIERLVGVRASPGGQHPGRGTRNALIALGPATYLEIIAPDPEQPSPKAPRPFGIDRLKESKLVTWAANAKDLDQLRREAASKGVQLGDVMAGSRRRSDGVVLSWQSVMPAPGAADGIVPFFIDWGQSSHPARTAAQGATLVDLRAEHPDAERIQDALRRLGLELPVKVGPRAALIAVIKGPRGQVELR